MKLIVLQENLQKAVSLSSHFISSKAHLPILGNILLKTDKSKLILSATNLETSVTTSIGAKIEKEGEITINGKTFNDIVSNLFSGSIELEVDKEQLKITSGKFKSNILGSNSADFPSLPQVARKNKFTLQAEEFKSALYKTLFAVSLDETRPILTGVLFSFLGKSLKLVATDGFRLSEVKLKAEVNIDDLKIIIPKAVLHEITKLEVDPSKDEIGEIEVSFDKESNQIVFMIGDTILSSRIIEGDFPDYEKIIPSNSIATISMDKIDLEKAVKLASVFSRDSGNIVKLQFIDDRLLVKAESSSSGNQEMEVEIRSEDKSEVEIEIMFNFRFIEDILKIIEDDEVKIVISPDNKASKFQDPKSPNFLHIIMPIRTS